MSPRRARTGAAMIEAVIALPVLAMLLGGTLFVRERYLGRQRALLDARRCAWAHALSGCAAPPDGCDVALQPRGEDPDSDAIMSAARARGTASAIDVFDEVPLLGAALSALFGTFTAATADSATAVPWDRRHPVVDRAQQVVLCNERPRDVLQAAQNVFCKHVPIVPCTGG